MFGSPPAFDGKTGLRQHIDHDIVFFDPYGHSLGDVGPLNDGRARRGRYRISLRADALGGAIRLTGADVEFPTVPGTADDLALAGIAVLAWLGRKDEARHGAFAKAAALMGTAIQHAEEFAIEIEDRDGSSFHGEELTATGRDIACRCENMPAHAPTPYTAR